jgi:hypothetical protein
MVKKLQNHSGPFFVVGFAGATMATEVQWCFVCYWVCRCPKGETATEPQWHFLCCWVCVCVCVCVPQWLQKYSGALSVIGFAGAPRVKKLQNHSDAFSVVGFAGAPRVKKLQNHSGAFSVNRERY